MVAAEELAGQIGQTTEACEALGVARSTLYRRRQVTPEPKRRPRPHRALDETAQIRIANAGSVGGARGPSGSEAEPVSSSQRRAETSSFRARKSSGPCTVSGSSTRRPPRCGPRFWTREPTSARFARCIGFWRSTARSESAGTNGAIRTTRSRSCWPKRPTRFGRGILRSFVAPSSGPTRFSSPRPDVALTKPSST